MAVCVAAPMLSSSVEYLSTRLYNSSIVVGGSKESEWKKGVDGAKLLLKFEGLRPYYNPLRVGRLTRTSL